MAQSDHKTAESSESSEERGMLFVASQESAVITEPGNGALDDPSAAIAAQRPAILSQVLGPTVGPVRRDHFDAQFCEGLIQGVAIITLVSDEAFWFNPPLTKPRVCWTIAVSPTLAASKERARGTPLASTTS